MSVQTFTGNGLKALVGTGGASRAKGSPAFQRDGRTSVYSRAAAQERKVFEFNRLCAYCHRHIQATLTAPNQWFTADQGDVRCTMYDDGHVPEETVLP